MEAESDPDEHDDTIITQGERPRPGRVVKHEAN